MIYILDKVSEDLSQFLNWVFYFKKYFGLFF